MHELLFNMLSLHRMFKESLFPRRFSLILQILSNCSFVDLHFSVQSIDKFLQDYRYLQLHICKITIFSYGALKYTKNIKKLS